MASTDDARGRVEQAGLEFLSLGVGESEEEAKCRGVTMGKSNSSSLQASMDVIIDISFGNAAVEYSRSGAYSSPLRQIYIPRIK